MKAEKVKSFMIMLVQLVLLSSSLYAIKRIIFLFVERTNFSDRMASMAGMIFLSAVILIAAKIRKYNLSVFPKKFSVLYICATAVAGVLLVLNPSNFTGGGKELVLLAYSAIVTPIFEEIIFRGYVWNKLNGIFSKEWITYAVSSVLFALWHIGYIDSISFRVHENLFHFMLWKVITGLCFGVVLGLVRMKSKNCYSTMLLHGVMNIFGR